MGSEVIEAGLQLRVASAPGSRAEHTRGTGLPAQPHELLHILSMALLVGRTRSDTWVSWLQPSPHGRRNGCSVSKMRGTEANVGLLRPAGLTAQCHPWTRLLRLPSVPGWTAA